MIVRPVIASISLALSLAVVAAAAPKPTINQDRQGLAMKGYDPVAYFVSGQPARGAADVQYQWNGATWRFSNAQNRELFVRDPEKYAPQFGGYCAWAVSRGYTADGDPEAWKIVDGRLYLNYSKRVQRMWEQDIPGNIEKARANWPAVLK